MPRWDEWIVIYQKPKIDQTDTMLCYDRQAGRLDLPYYLDRPVHLRSLLHHLFANSLFPLFGWTKRSRGCSIGDFAGSVERRHVSELGKNELAGVCLRLPPQSGGVGGLGQKCQPANRDFKRVPPTTRLRSGDSLLLRFTKTGNGTHIDFNRLEL